jgi:hypothetical protein
MTRKLAVRSVGLEEVEARWWTVTCVEEEEGAVNSGSRRRWPATQAANRCYLMRG